jgi:hypothetical protein
MVAHLMAGATDEVISAVESIISGTHGNVLLFFTKQLMPKSSMADTDRSLRRGLPYARARAMGGGSILTFEWFRTQQEAEEAISRLPHDYPRQFVIYLPDLDTEGTKEANENPNGKGRMHDWEFVANAVCIAAELVSVQQLVNLNEKDTRKWIAVEQRSHDWQ